MPEFSEDQLCSRILSKLLLRRSNPPCLALITTLFLLDSKVTQAALSPNAAAVSGTVTKMRALESPCSPL